MKLETTINLAIGMIPIFAILITYNIYSYYSQKKDAYQEKAE